MSRILLIDPPLYKHPFWDPIRYAQHLGLWSIASHLVHLGHEVRTLLVPAEGWDHQVLVDNALREEGQFANYHRAKSSSLRERGSQRTFLDYHGRRGEQFLYVGLPPEEICRRVSEFDPDLIGISSIASCHHRSVVDLAQRLRWSGFNQPIVVGGQHATAMPEALLSDARGAIDWVVRGEGEQVMAAIANHPLDRDAISRIAGVCYVNSDGEIVSNKRPPFFNLSEIALPNAGILASIPMPLAPSHTFGTQGRKYTDVMFSVGCHKACAYCFSPQMRGGVREYSEQSIRSILEDLWTHGFRELVLQDDDLLNDRAAFIRLIALISEYGFRWQDNGGIEIERLDESLIDEIAKSGCTGLYVPVNPRQIADRFPNAEALLKSHLLSLAKEKGIYTYTSAIYGVPNLDSPAKAIDEIKTLRDFHLDLLQKGYVDASLAFPLSALPGTKWYNELKRHPEFIVDTDDWLSYSIYVPQIRPRVCDRDEFDTELVEVHRRLNELQTSYPWFSPFPNHWPATTEG